MESADSEDEVIHVALGVVADDTERGSRDSSGEMYSIVERWVGDVTAGREGGTRVEMS